jgi:RNA polymerase sigma-54 factor
MSYSVLLDLHNKQSQQLKQSQHLMMSPQMQQAINLLQVPVMELSTMIEAEMENNPILEIMDEEAMGDRDLEDEVQEERMQEETPVEKEISFDERDFEIMKQLDEEFRDHFSESGGYNTKVGSQEEKLRTFMESSISEKITFFEFLMRQARDVFDTKEDIGVAEVIIGNLDGRGFLEMPLEEISLLHNVDIVAVKRVLKAIHTFEPYGVGAVDVRSSLLIQLECIGKKRSLAYTIIEKHYEEVLHNRIPIIKKKLGVSGEEIMAAIHDDVAPLNIYPGNWSDDDAVNHIAVDVSVSREKDNLVVKIDDEYVPSVKMNSRYIKMLEDEAVPDETREYIRSKVASGKWLLRNIYQRNETLLRIMEYLVDYQRAFFLSSNGCLRPLTMKSVAEKLELHESTVARAVANKYVESPRGVVLMRSFFTNAYVTNEGEVSSRTVKNVLLEIIKKENRVKPFSDEAISSLIKDKGIPCARRTVAKYRKEFNIGNASQRRVYT